MPTRTSTRTKRRSVRGAGTPPRAEAAVVQAFALAADYAILTWFEVHGFVADALPAAVLKKARSKLDTAIKAIDASANAQTKKIERVVGAQAVGGKQLLDRFRTRNVMLIKTVERDTKRKLDAALKKYGNLHRDALAAKLQEVAGVSRSRAKFWAVDQTNKLHASIVETKHRSLGIVEYVWRTSGDEAVRETHLAHEGKTFRYDDPPDTGNPGQDFRCRCHADPVLPTAQQVKTALRRRAKPKPALQTLAQRIVEEVPRTSLLDQRSQVVAELREAVSVGEAQNSAVRSVVRQQIRETFPGATPLLPGARLEVRSNAMMGTTRGLYERDGTVVLRTGVAENIAEGMSDLKKLRFGGSGYFRRDAVRTLFHEELHAMSRTGKYAYRGVGRALEESGTELNARVVAARAIDAQIPIGSYEKLINQTIKPLEIELGLSNADARAMLRDAWARANYRGGSANITAERVLQAWLDALPETVTPVQRARLWRAYRDLELTE